MSEIIEENKNIGKPTYAGAGNSVADFEEITRSKDLFNDGKFVVFENFFKGKTPKWKAEIDYTKLEKEDNIYVFWEDADLNALAKKTAALANRKNVFEFKIPNLLWNFLDGIKPFSVGAYNYKPLQELREILKSIDENYLFLMLVRQFRLLILSKEKYKDYPSEYKRLTFQKYKLDKQASLFSKEQLINVYKNLRKIEERQKTGNAVYDLKTEIEKFLICL